MLPFVVRSSETTELMLVVSCMTCKVMFVCSGAGRQFESIEPVCCCYLRLRIGVSISMLLLRAVTFTAIVHCFPFNYFLKQTWNMFTLSVPATEELLCSGMETSGVSDDSVPRYRCRLGPVRSLLLNPLLKLFMGGTRLAPPWSVAIECTYKGQEMHRGDSRFKYVASICRRCIGSQNGVLLRTIFKAIIVQSSVLL